MFEQDSVAVVDRGASVVADRARLGLVLPVGPVGPVRPVLPVGPVGSGPDAAAWLAGFDPRSGSRADRVDALAVVQRHFGWLASVEAGLLASFQGDAEAAAAADPDDKEWVSEEVGAVLRLRGDYARNRMVTAAQLVRRLPETRAQLSAGVVSPVQARLLADAVTGLDDVACSRVEARVLVRAGDQSSTQFRQSLRRAVLAAAPRTAEQAHELQAATRRVFIAPADDGMGWLMAYLPVPELMSVKTSIWRLAQNRKNRAERAERSEITSATAAIGTASATGTIGDEPDEFVPIDAYRADALVELAQRYLNDSDPTGAINRQHPTVQVVVGLSTLTGDSDEPGDVAGYGPIPAGLARCLAADPDGTWQRLVVDPLGRLVDYGQQRYRPPKDLADFVRGRDRTCTFPTCNRAARDCEIDHIHPWGDCGPTCADNLTPLCRRHHHLKHEGGWKLIRDPATGTVEWTSPTGRRFTNPRPG